MVGGAGGGVPVGPAPVPIRKSNNSGCIVWGAAGCGLLLVLCIALFAVGLSQFNGNSGLRKVVDSAVTADQRGQILIGVRDALDAYREANNGKYPPTLKALVPDYLEERELPKSEGNTPAEYTPPGRGALPDTPVVSIYAGQGGFAGQKLLFYERLLQDGRVVHDQVQRMELSPSKNIRTKR